MLLPLDQFVIRTGGDAGARIDAVVDHGGHALFVDERPPGVDLLLGVSRDDAQRDRMVLPVQQVITGDMAPESHILYLTGVEEMVAAFPVDTPLGIEGITDAFGRGEVVFRLMGIGHPLRGQYLDFLIIKAVVR